MSKWTKAQVLNISIYSPFWFLSLFWVIIMYKRTLFWSISFYCFKYWCLEIVNLINIYFLIVLKFWINSIDMTNVYHEKFMLIFWSIVPSNILHCHKSFYWLQYQHRNVEMSSPSHIFTVTWRCDGNDKVGYFCSFQMVTKFNWLRTSRNIVTKWFSTFLNHWLKKMNWNYYQ